MSGGNNQNDEFDQFDDGAFESLDDFSTAEAKPTVEADQAEPAMEAAAPEPARTGPSQRLFEDEKQGTLAKLTDLSPYTVMLAISLFAVFVCIIILWSELASYEYDRKAKDAAIVAVPVTQAEWTGDRV